VHPHVQSLSIIHKKKNCPCHGVQETTLGDLVLLVEETRVSGKNYQPAGNISEAL
jgi:hypothetical protein